MYNVHLLSFPAKRQSRLERVVQKHGPRTLDRAARLALLSEVRGGHAQIIARYVEEHTAENVVLELKMLDAVAEVRQDQPVADVPAAA